MADKSRREQLADMLGEAGTRAGANWSENLRKGLCPCCGQGINEADFRDELSRKEFALSHLCQVCQDKVFSDPSTH